MRQAFECHPRAGQMLARAVRRDRLAHAYLFVGPRGVGKLRAARELGRVAACHAPADGDGWLEPCGDCDSCRMIFEPGSHHDVHIVGRSAVAGTQRDQEEEPERSVMPEVLSQELKLRDFEDARRLLTRSVSVAARRVLIIPEAERMDADAAGYLLKTLEEPLPKTLIILTTTNISAVVPTIASRCQHVFFPPVPDAVVLRLLCGDGPPTPTARAAARLAAGRPELARRLLAWDVALAFEEAVLGGFRNAMRGDSLALLTAADGLRRACIQWWEFAEQQEFGAPPGDESDKSTRRLETLRERAVRLAAPDVLSVCELWLRDVLAARMGVDPQTLLYADRQQELLADAQLFSHREITDRLRAVAETRRRIAQNVNSRLALEVLALSLPPGRPVLGLPTSR